MGKMVEKSTTGTQQIRGLFNNEVELYQFMAQDNIPFHTIIFHATLIEAEEDYTLVSSVGMI